MNPSFGLPVPPGLLLALPTRTPLSGLGGGRALRGEGVAHGDPGLHPTPPDHDVAVPTFPRERGVDAGVGPTTRDACPGAADRRLVDGTRAGRSRGHPG